MVAAGDRDGVQPKRAEAGERGAHAGFGKVPSVGIDRLVAHRFRVPSRRRRSRVEIRGAAAGFDILRLLVHLMDRNEPMSEYFDAHRPATAFDHDSTLVVAMELSGKSWQLGAVVPGVSRRPKRGLKAGDTEELLAFTQLR